MKLTGVEIHAPNTSTVIYLSFRDPGLHNAYNIKAIVGLDADEITARFYGNSSNLVDQFYDLALKKRDVVLRIGLNPRFDQNETYSDLRDTVYKMVSSSRTGRIQLYFMNGTDVISVLSGFMGKFESAQFEQVQEVQLTINCDEPMLKSLTPVSIDVSNLGFTNISVTDDKSTAWHGFKFEVHFTSTIASSLVISDPNDPSWNFTIFPPWSWLSGDILSFSSEYNNRYLNYIRSGVVTPMADTIAAGSSWPVIFPGNNTFAFSLPTRLAWNSLSYYYNYWGV
jgi:hypothetical protein